MELAKQTLEFRARKRKQLVRLAGKPQGKLTQRRLRTDVIAPGDFRVPLGSGSHPGFHAFVLASKDDGEALQPAN